MSKHKQKNLELDCLRAAIACDNIPHENTRRILTLLSGSDVVRTHDESPDIMRTNPRRVKNFDFVGVEHFKVEHFNEYTPSGKLSGVGADFRKTKDAPYKKYREADCAQTRDEAIYDLIERSCEYTRLGLKSTYTDLIRHFKSTLLTHLNKVDRYREHMREYSRGDFKLAFLIELHTELSGLVINGRTQNTSGDMPMFEDIVELLEGIKPSQVDYVVLSYYSCVAHDKPCKVIAFNTGDVRKQLKKQGVSVYKYVGEDLYGRAYDKVKVHSEAYMRGGEKYYETHCTDIEPVTELSVLNLVECALRAYELESRGDNYVVTGAVALYMSDYDAVTLERIRKDLKSHMCEGGL